MQSPIKLPEYMSHQTAFSYKETSKLYKMIFSGVPNSELF